MKLIAMLGCCSTLAFAATDVAAQTVPESATNEEALPAADEGSEAEADPADGGSEIIVTGSRVVTDGYQAPTPVTVVGSEELKNTAPSITEALRQLPQLTGSSSPASVTFTPNGSAASTFETANLRNLGITRTLVLLDGRRPPTSGVTGTADIGMFPLQLVKRVDVVTGGASAAYGSDAVAGVVNFILDTKFRGVAAEARSGISTHGDGHSYNVQASGGRGFAGDRGSLIVSGNLGHQDRISGYEREWSTRGWSTIPNVLFGQPGQPQTILRENVNLSGAATGGLILTPGPLRDIQFDVAGNPFPFRHGTNNTGTVEVNGDGPRYPADLTSDYTTRSAFAHADFDLTDGVTVFAEGGYGYTKAHYKNLFPYYIGGNALVLQRDNAFLPASIRQVMVNNNINSIALGKLNTTFGRNDINNVSKTINGIVGFNARLGEFTLDGYYEHGETRFNLLTENQQVLANMRRAIDAVVHPTTGQIVCRSTLTNPGNGCVPWNPIGEAPLTAEQRAYQQSTGFARSVAKQDVAALTLRGNLFTNWAGEVAAAVGGEYRDLSGTITVDPVSAVIGFANNNPQGSSGSYSVKEAFGEVLFPLFRGTTFLPSLDLNGAVRRTDYSTSGGVTTWKVGLAGEILAGLRARGTYSQDIRAPNIGDLFGPRVRSQTTLTDPFNNNQTFTNIPTFSGSNPDLLPERARTLTAGLTFQPTFLPGLGFSVDYYRINIKDAISTLSFQRIVNECFAGDTYLCSQITRDSSNVITLINGAALNIQTVKISGVDLDASYRTNLGSDTLTLRAIATYLDDFTSIAPGAVPIQQAGTGSFPRFRGNLQATYVAGDTTIAVQHRIVGSHRRAIPPSTVDDDHVGAVHYTSFTIRQKIDAGDAQPELFLSVNNLFDRDPPVSDTSSTAIGVSRAADVTLYDVVGRYITVGARVRF